VKQSDFTILENTQLAGDIYRMVLEGDTSAIENPGQFVNIRLEGRFLRRPISVCDWEDGKLTLIYKILGKGTAEMTGFQPGKALNLLTGLGNGFDLADAGDHPLLLGGGVGIPPLYGLAKRLRAQGVPVTAVLGFNRSADIFYEAEFQALGAETLVLTADGSYGEKGFVTTPLPRLRYSYYYTCGPEAMLKAVYAAAVTSGQLSFEKRMGCGFGACMGCSCRTITGNKRICKEGPVLRKEEILWED